ncbi:efflux RND transporter permease subunit, partial [Escherichia coli]
VLLVVPLGVIGALLATWMRGLENDVYFQVGLLTVIGLSAKNAILIVEFANEMNQKGHDQDFHCYFSDIAKCTVVTDDDVANVR